MQYKKLIRTLTKTLWTKHLIQSSHFLEIFSIPVRQHSGSKNAIGGKGNTTNELKKKLFATLLIKTSYHKVIDHLQVKSTSSHS